MAFPANIPQLIKGMFEDVQREGKGELEWSKDVEKAIGTKTALLVKEYQKTRLT